MKPQWVINGLVNKDGKLWQRWTCRQCDEKCSVTTGLNYEPGGGLCKQDKSS